VKGRLRGIEHGRNSLELHALVEHGGATRSLAFNWLVNCTEGNTNAAASSNPLISNLVERGTLIPDPLGLGIAVDAESRAIDGSERGRPDLFALGPLTIGRFWEITSIPEIRDQAEAVAGRILEQAGVQPRTRSQCLN
jgi:uncharacterized NAD(P)/FAD-binding protein YdhS